MKVCHVYRTYFPDTQGGLEETIRQICLNTIAHGVKSNILALSPDPRPQIIHREEAVVFRAKRHAEIASCGMSLNAMSMFKSLARECDLVHYHFPWPFADFLHFAARVRKPSVVTYHSDIIRQKFLGRAYQPIQNRFLGSVDRIVCTSPNYFATSTVLSRFESKVRVIPIGINDTEPPAQQASSERLSEQLREPYFLFIGVLRYYKGLHILLDAIKGAPYNVIIAGSGPTEKELEQQARELALDNVIFAGQVTDEEKATLLQRSLGIVFPSYLRAEAFGVTLLEGAQHRKPLISTEVGSGTSHVNIDRETGIIVAPGSSHALRQAMDQLFFRPEMAALMGKNARKRYERLFTGKLMGTRYADLYHELTDRLAYDPSETSAELSAS